MSIKLAKEYYEAFESGANYFSQSFSIIGPSPLALFSRIEKEGNEFSGTRFFWQTPDESITFIGLGEAAFFSSSEVKTMGKELQGYFYDGLPSIIFGGFPFDEEGNSAPLWGDLAQGGFILPTILLKYAKNSKKIEVVVTCDRPKKFSELELFFEQLTKDVTLFIEKNKSNKTIQQIVLCKNQTELAVPQWIDTVNQAVETINQKETSLKKVVLARQLSIELENSLILADMLERLAIQQPNTYLFLFERFGRAFIGATPERLLSATSDELRTAAVAGSIARGDSAEEDQRLGKELLRSAKNVQEHQIVVDRISKEMGPFITGEISVSERHLLKNRDIQHLYATITGRRKRGWSLVEMILQLHPTPALGGEPKTEAMAWIREHEPIGRGMYGAPIGWLSLNEDQGEFAVGIRSAVIQRNQALLYAGCGIVSDSVAQEECEETKIKFEPMRRGLLGNVTPKSHD